jgi:hypothetical protein
MPSQLTLVDREPIYAALLLLLQTNLQGSPPVFVTVGRRHVHPEELAPAQQPALFIVEMKESRQPRPQGTGGKLTLDVWLVMYCFESAINQPPGQETTLAATQINALLLAIETALAPVFGTGPQNRQTLGGLVEHCWIEGETLIDQGIYTQQGGAIVPLKILVP